MYKCGASRLIADGLKNPQLSDGAIGCHSNIVAYIISWGKMINLRWVESRGHLTSGWLCAHADADLTMLPRDRGPTLGCVQGWSECLMFGLTGFPTHGPKSLHHDIVAQMSTCVSSQSTLGQCVDFLLWIHHPYVVVIVFVVDYTSGCTRTLEQRVGRSLHV